MKPICAYPLSFWRGMRVFEHPALDAMPKLTLSPAVHVSPEYRARFNAWALEFFGRQEPQVIVIGDSAYMGRQTMEVLLREVGR